jgi:hypothetical protein
MVGLEADGESAGEADGVAEAGDHAALRGDGDQVLLAHQLADGGDHLGGEAGTQRGQRFWFGGEQEVAEFADRE